MARSRLCEARGYDGARVPYISYWLCSNTVGVLLDRRDYPNPSSASMRSVASDSGADTFDQTRLDLWLEGGGCSCLRE